MNCTPDTISGILEKYYHNYGREFPWRNRHLSIYEIITTEILLKRTNSNKVSRYWNEFFDSFPNILSLYNAREEKIADLLSPLGLQNQRAKQLKTLAKEVVEVYKGKIPSLNNLKLLSGIGDYVSNATGIMTQKLKNLPVDVNVKRVFCRFEFQTKLNEIKVKNILELGKAKSVFFGLLDLSAQICKPLNPKCDTCPLNECCRFVKNKYEFTCSYSYSINSAQILVLSTKQNKILQNKGEIKLNLDFKVKKSTYIYVKKPVSSIIGKGELKSSSILTNVTYFSPYRKLIELRNFSTGLNFRSQVTWVHPMRKFKVLLREIDL